MKGSAEETSTPRFVSEVEPEWGLSIGKVEPAPTGIEIIDEKGRLATQLIVRQKIGDRVYNDGRFRDIILLS